jgi:hypothetical protein
MSTIMVWSKKKIHTQEVGTTTGHSTKILSFDFNMSFFYHNQWALHSEIIYTWVHSGFSGVHGTRSVVLCVMFCRSLFAHLLFFFWSLKPSRCNGVMASVLASSAVDLRSGQTKDYKIGICCFSAKHTAPRRKRKDWLARNQDNVSEWGNMSIRGLLFQRLVVSLSLVIERLRWSNIIPT